jgi:hypothetical protein
MKLYKSVFILLTIITTNVAYAQKQTTRDSTGRRSGWFRGWFKRRPVNTTNSAGAIAGTPGKRTGSSTHTVRGGFGKRGGSGS